MPYFFSYTNNCGDYSIKFVIENTNTTKNDFMLLIEELSKKLLAFSIVLKNNEYEIGL